MSNKTNCPNCGAPIEMAECPYCGTMFLDFGALDLGNIEKPIFLRLKKNGRTILRKVILTNAAIRIDTDDIPLYADNQVIYRMRPETETIELSFQTIASGKLFGAVVDDWRTPMHPEADKDIYDQIKEVIG